jgi:multimeric flavodoxin WrbA
MQGNTGRLLEEMIRGVMDAEVETVSLSKLKVFPCVGCDACHSTGICSIKDDYEMIKEKLLACDAFVLASPNYIFSVTAQMKAFFDRCNGLIHCMALEGKYGAVVETSGGGGDEEVISYMERFIGTLGAQSVGGVGSPIAGIRTFPDEAGLFEKARQLGQSLCQSVQEQRRFPEQQEFLLAFKERMSGLVQYMGDYWVFEREYWKNKLS